MRKHFESIRKRLSYIVKEHTVPCILIVAVVLVVSFICFPRNVKSLLLKNNKTATIEIIKDAGVESEVQRITLNEKQQSKLLELFDNSYVHLKVFHKDYVNDNYMGYSIIISNNRDLVYFFSSDIISINGTQYKVYGQTLANEFKSIIESEN